MAGVDLVLTVLLMDPYPAENGLPHSLSNYLLTNYLPSIGKFQGVDLQLRIAPGLAKNRHFGASPTDLNLQR